MAIRNLNTQKVTRKSVPAPRPVFNSRSQALQARPLTRGAVSSRQDSRLRSAQIREPELIPSVRSRVKTGKRKLSFTKLISKLSIFAVLIILLYGGFGFVASRIGGGSDNNASLAIKVSNLIKLQDVNPKIYKVQDVVPLKSKSPFYQAVEPGDYVLVYNEDNKVLIYRESANVIVNIDSVNNL